MNRETPRGTLSVGALCALLGISRSGYYGARRAAATRAEAQSPSQPAAPSVRKGRVPLVPDERVLVAIREVAQREPAWGVRKVWATLRRAELRVSRERVWSLMRREGLVFRAPHHEERTQGHVSVPEPNRRLATDFGLVWTRREGWVCVAPTIDCGCRSVLGMVVSKSQESFVVLRSVDQALEAAFGSPAQVPEGVELRSDHGSQYTGHDCASLLARWSVSHTFSPVGRPTGNAVAERVIRTLKEEVIWLQDWEDAAEVERAVLGWVRRYNEQRPHMALGWKTPAEYRAAHLTQEVRQAA